MISLVVVVCRIMWKKMRGEKRGHQADSGKLSHYEVAMPLGRGWWVGGQSKVWTGVGGSMERMEW